MCGAAFRTGEVWRHANGEHVHLGWECADKFGAVSGDRDAATAMLKAMAEMRSAAAREKKLATARDAWLAEHPATAAALESRTATRADVPGCPKHGHDYSEEWCAGCERAKREAFRSPEAKRNEAIAILADLYSKQEAFAASLAARVAAPIVARVEKPKATGRVEFAGRVVSVKEGENAWGTYRRFTVVVETPEGEWLANGNVPAGIQLERGQDVRIKATLEAGSDAHFAFAKRPVFLS